MPRVPTDVNEEAVAATRHQPLSFEALSCTASFTRSRTLDHIRSTTKGSASSVAAVLAAAVLAAGAGCGGDHAAVKVRATTGRISWPHAQALLQRCRVKRVEQAHNRLVTLTLRNGIRVNAYEPRIDDVVHQLPRLNARCGPITLAME